VDSFGQKSRYYPVQRVYNRIYDEGAGFESDPIRQDRTVGRRYTTWASRTEYKTYVTKEGDTMAGLAFRFYGDSSLWYVIADFNVQVFYPLDLEANTALTIPPLSVTGRVPSRL